MPEQTKSYYRNFVYLFTGNSISQVVPFLLAPVIGRTFSPEELSVQENFLAIVSMISIVAAGRFEVAFVLPKIQKRANNLLALSVFITLCFTAISLLAIFFSDEISKMYKDELLGKYIYYLSPAVFLVGINSILVQWIIRSGKYSLISASRISQSVIQNSGYAFLGYLGWGINGLLLGWTAGHIISIFILSIPSLKYFTKADVSTTEMKSVAKEYKDFPMINSLHAFTDIFITQFLLFWLITRNYGAVSLGLFAVMNRYLRAPFNLIGNAVGQLYYREASIHKNDNKLLHPIFNKSVTIVSIVTIPAMIVVFIWGPDLFALYLGEKWRAAGDCARIMSFPIMLNLILSPVSSTPLLYNKQKEAYIISFILYGLSTGALLMSIYMKYDFQTALIGYSAGVSAFYIILFLWYRMLINSQGR